MTAPKTPPTGTAFYLDSSKFTPIEQLTEKTGGKFSHTVLKVQDQNGTIYYKKKVDDLFHAALEVTGGQLFNLLMPYQPKTFLTRDPGGTISILSQEIPGYESLAVKNRRTLKDDLNTGNIKGVGSVFTASYVFNETDSKRRNLGDAPVNNQRLLIKIDNDWCFSALRHPGKFRGDGNPYTSDITESGFSRLPLQSDYKTWNLLDRFMEGIPNDAYLPNSNQFRLLDDSLPDKPHFREEVNEMAFKITLIPKEFSQAIASASTDDPQVYENIFNEMLDRQLQLITVASKNESFQKYLYSKKAEDCLQQTIKDFEKFQQDNHIDLPGLDLAKRSGQMFDRMKKLVAFQQQERILTAIDNKIANLAPDKPREHYALLQARLISLNTTIGFGVVIGRRDVVEVAKQEKVSTEAEMATLKKERPIEIAKEQLQNAEHALQKSRLDNNPEEGIKQAKLAADKAKQLADLLLGTKHQTDAKGYEVLAKNYKALASTNKTTTKPIPGKS